MNVPERINRILFILSYVSQNQGVTVDELAHQADLTPRQLMKELEFMLLIGKPPFRPDDYVDIYVEDQRVYVEYDQMLNRPLRFTRPEAFALLMSLQLLDPEVDPERVRSLKNKIEEGVASSLDPAAPVDDRILLETPSRPLSDYLAFIRRAIEKQKKIAIEYYSLAHNQTTQRTIRPYLLMKYLGYWYLTGHCELRRDLRTFKFERILSVKPLTASFPQPQDLDLGKYKEDFLQSMGGDPIEISFDQTVAPWVQEQWGSSAKRQKDGSVTLSLFSETLEYPSRLILSFAPHARPLSPPELIDKVRHDVQDILDSYSMKTPN